MKALFPIAASAMLLCAPAGAKERAAGENGRQTDEAAEARKSDEKDPNETICRREEVTGSRLRETVCRTRAEWKLHDDAAKYDARRVKGRRAINVGTS